MKNLPTYEQFNEQYLPYFGVKQALDDAADPSAEEKKEAPKTKISDLHRMFAMTPTWWNAWKSENGENYDITQDAFSHTYTVVDKKTNKVVFIYDYSRYKIFTNESPQLFVLKGNISPEELEKAKEKDVENPNKKDDKEQKAAADSGEESGDSGDNSEESDDEFKL